MNNNNNNMNGETNIGECRTNKLNIRCAKFLSPIDPHLHTNPVYFFRLSNQKKIFSSLTYMEKKIQDNKI